VYLGVWSDFFHLGFLIKALCALCPSCILHFNILHVIILLKLGDLYKLQTFSLHNFTWHYIPEDHHHSNNLIFYSYITVNKNTEQKGGPESLVI
jgi:hypothetical protein